LAKPYRLTAPRRFFNRFIGPLIRMGLAGRHTYLLTTHGRKTGTPLTHPVTLIEDHERFLVAPYGERAWVKNARASGRVELSRARRSERLRVEELSPRDAAPILREYRVRVKVVAPFLDGTPESPLDAWEEEAKTHPVFRLLPES
jgi:deazaflavin-dependent oxidoreductase (nitroreductase family)